MNEIQSFISILAKLSDCSCKKSQYIHQNKGAPGFVITYSKNDKSLNTQMIAERAFESLEGLYKNRELTLESKAEIFASLGQTLKQYNLRVRKSKPWICRLLYLLGIKSTQERKIDSLAKTALNKAKCIHERSKRLDEIVAQKLTRFNRNEFKTKLTLFNFKVLDSIDFEIYDEKQLVLADDARSITSSNEVQSLSPFEATASLIEDLTAFHHQLVHQESKLMIQEAIEELQFEFRTSALISNVGESYFKHWWERKVSSQSENLLLIEEIAEEIQLKTTQLSANSQSGSSFIFTGGYSKALSNLPFAYDGHHLLYEIRKQFNGLYAFTVINTGIGASYPFKEEFKQAHQEVIQINNELFPKESFDESSRVAASGLAPISKVKAQFPRLEAVIKKVQELAEKSAELIYSDLTEEELSKSFFFDLLSLQVIGTKGMSEVIAFFQSKLYHPSAPNKMNGRHYHVQHKGNCTVKPLCKWLHRRLGPSLYQQFSIFKIDREVASIEKMIPNPHIVGKQKEINPITNKTVFTDYRGSELIQFMKTEGLKVKARKTAKLGMKA